MGSVNHHKDGRVFLVPFLLVLFCSNLCTPTKIIQASIFLPRNPFDQHSDQCYYLNDITIFVGYAFNELQILDFWLDLVCVGV